MSIRQLAPALLLSFFALLRAAPASAADDRGWGYLTNKLVADGVDRDRVAQAFGDPRIEPFTGLDFSAQPPRESRRLYRNFLRPSSIAAARRCRASWGSALEAAERAHGVSANVLAAILYVESGCGRNTGSSLVFYRLARLAMADDPENLRRNLERLAGKDGRTDPVIAAKVRARARYLEETFYPEVRALFEVADRMGVGPLDIRGSGSGAFGYAQFLPSSYLDYAVDGDGDGRVSPYDPADAAASCAHYFVRHGWHAGLTRAQRRAAVWQYNRSDAYVDTVLTLAARIAGPAPASRRKARASVHRARRHRRGLATRGNGVRHPSSRPG